MTLRTTARGDSVEEIRRNLLAEYGPGCKIESVEKVTVGGIAGFMAKHFLEATVLVPGDGGTHQDSGMPLSSRLGIAALLADADDTEDSFQRSSVEPHFSTESNDFDALITELSQRNPDKIVAEPSTSPTASLVPEEFTAKLHVPVLATHPGDLVLVIGLGQDALGVAQSMAKHMGRLDVRGGGLVKVRGSDALTDRRSALLARAHSVGIDKATICAFGIEPGADVNDVLEAINADQVWVAVDAGRKPEDTRRWVSAISARLGVHAVAVVNSRYTDTPQTVNRLGLPVGWSDGAPTAVPGL